MTQRERELQTTWVVGKSGRPGGFCWRRQQIQRCRSREWFRPRMNASWSAEPATACTKCRRWWQSRLGRWRWLASARWRGSPAWRFLSCWWWSARSCCCSGQWSPMPVPGWLAGVGWCWWRQLKRRQERSEVATRGRSCTPPQPASHPL